MVTIIFRIQCLTDNFATLLPITFGKQLINICIKLVEIEM